MNKEKSLIKSIAVGLAVVLVIVVFAYAFQVTDVNFETTRSKVRLTQITRVIRALMKPSVVEYEKEETTVMAPFYLPCPENGAAADLPEIDQSGPYLKTSLPCASPKDMVTVEGFNMPPNSKGPINFFTFNEINKEMGNFETDANGYFIAEVEIPLRQPVEEAQHITAIARINVGAPKLTENATSTGEKIVETIFMALLATTIGTLLAIPMSFFAARNLAVGNTSSLTGVAFTLLGWPAGIWVGLQISNWLLKVLAPGLDNTWYALLGAVVSAAIAYLILRSSISEEDEQQVDIKTRFSRRIAVIIAALSGISTIIFLGSLTRLVGAGLVEKLGSFGFLGNFLFQLGEITLMLLSLVVAVSVGAVLGGILGKIGGGISDNMQAPLVKLINIALGAVAGAAFFAILGAGVNWIYQIDDLVKTLYWPAGIGALLGVLLALSVGAKQALPVGLIVYYIARTILNTTRSIEPLIMAIVAVIWVGIGPFAGSLALALHTVAALTKLYSEQVEGIQPGPLEAVQATGANKLQTIIYAVIPQIIPPYISFTMYRWDINVRSSTIIGIVGGGGIGFLLMQNISLLLYRNASVQMLAIAVVVASMDYISAVIRERYV
ncbi:MAG: ABC transporter permease subunit [Pseudomonadota bacterium]